MNRKILLISLIVLLLIVVITVIVVIVRRNSKPVLPTPIPVEHDVWTDDLKSQVSQYISANPIFKCPLNYSSIVPCLMDAIVKNYKYPDIHDRLTNKHLTSDDINLLMSCLNINCVKEIFSAENAGANPVCIDCIVSKSYDFNNKDIVATANFLHSKSDDFMKLQTVCTDDEKCNVPKKPDVTPGGGVVPGGGNAPVPPIVNPTPGPVAPTPGPVAPPAPAPPAPAPPAPAPAPPAPAPAPYVPPPPPPLPGVVVPWPGGGTIRIIETNGARCYTDPNNISVVIKCESK